MGRAEERDLSQISGTGFTTEPWQWQRRPGLAPPVRVPPGERGAWGPSPSSRGPLSLSLLPGPYSPLAWVRSTAAIGADPHFHPVLASSQNLEKPQAEDPNIHPEAGHHAALLPGQEQEGAQLPPTAFPGARLLPPSGDCARAGKSRCEARRDRVGQGRRLCFKPPRFLELPQAPRVLCLFVS